jgi:L-fuconolactonase
VGDALAELADGEGGTYLRGIRHGVQSEPDPEWLCRPEVLRGIAAVGSAGMLYELLTIPVQLPAAVRTAAELPDVPFVLDHCSKPVIPSGELEPWAGQIRSLAALPNVSCKLSGLVTEAEWEGWTIDQLRPYVEVVLEAFGTDRVLWGSDWPVCLLASSYEGWASTAESLTAGLSDDERTAIFGSNARRLYGLA